MVPSRRPLPLLARIAADETVPELAKELFATSGRELSRLTIELRAIEVKRHWQNEMSRRLAEVDAIGPIGGCLLAIKVPIRRPPAAAATSRLDATAGKIRLSGIARAGDGALPPPWVGSIAVLKQVSKRKGNAFKNDPPFLSALMRCAL